MDFTELAKLRYSTRKYSPQPVEREKIEQCVEAARLAPSASNSQPWKFIIVDDAELREKVARETFSKMVAFNKFTLSAPVMVVISMEKAGVITQIGGRLKNKEYALIDCGIAAEHFCLKAAELGLGTCMLGWFNEAPVQKILGIPKERKIALLISLGYPDQKQPTNKKRKDINEILTYNSYNAENQNLKQ